MLNYPIQKRNKTLRKFNFDFNKPVKECFARFFFFPPVKAPLGLEICFDHRIQFTGNDNL